PGAWRRCNSLQWNDHCASLRLALHPENRTLQPVQRRFLGLLDSSLVRKKTDSPQRARRTQRKPLMLFLCVLRVLCGEKGFVFMGCRHKSSRVEQSCAKIVRGSRTFPIIDFHHEFLRTNLS
ncbi:MAG: hypothetical protein WC091_21870, partial [Sulfuricellaceae bacterium]